MDDVLARIVASKWNEVAVLVPRAAELRTRAADRGPARSLAAALRAPGQVRLLAEVKHRSPSAGEIRADVNPVAVARGYEANGAAAISVLTDGPFFGGALDDLVAVRRAVDVPVLRKDFVVDPLQLWEARAAGADAVLLIVRILSDASLRELLDLARELGMGALVEAHDAAELQRALDAGAALVGINNRDLATFRMDLETSLGLAGSVPPDAVLVAESGIRTAADVDRLGAAGVDAVLVGESLMREPDPGAAAARLTGRAKGSRAGR